MTESSIPPPAGPFALAPGYQTAATLEFPADFRFGSATAAFQIEGASTQDGREDSIWDTFCKVPGAVSGGHDGSIAADHYHRMPQDVALMKRLGLDTYRFSTSWARIKPGDREVNPLGLDFYSRLVDELLEQEITPWLTLYHWDLPQSLQESGGWANRETVHRFADYAVEVFQALGDRVKHWTTLNEPWCSSFLSYAAGEHAPGLTEPSQAVAAAHHLLLGHGLATQRIRELSSREHSLGITLNFTVADPADPADANDVDAARAIDGAFNRIFLDPIFRGSYPQDVLADMDAAGLSAWIRPGDLETISAPIDVLGVNYYNGMLVAAPAQPLVPETELLLTGPGGLPRRSPYVGSERVRTIARDLPITAMGWEVQPEGLERLLLRLQNDYVGPAGIHMIITENGAAYDDVPDESGFVDDSRTRGAYLEEHLRATHQAMSQGADVRGYLVWSLLDNFEWAWGYEKRFGVVRVDYESLARIPKASALWYSRVAASHCLLPSV